MCFCKQRCGVDKTVTLAGEGERGRRNTRTESCRSAFVGGREDETSTKKTTAASLPFASCSSRSIGARAPREREGLASPLHPAPSPSSSAPPATAMAAPPVPPPSRRDAALGLASLALLVFQGTALSLTLGHSRCVWRVNGACECVRQGARPRRHRVFPRSRPTLPHTSHTALATPPATSPPSRSPPPRPSSWPCAR